jgi:hypothetical protein
VDRSESVRPEEISRIEAAVRDANPVPSAELRVDSDEASAVTLLVERRRRVMATTPSPTEVESPGPVHRRRSMAWAFAAAFVVVLLVIGVAALFLRGDNVGVSDEPAPSHTITTPGMTTSAWIHDLELVTDIAGWERVDEPWLDYASVGPLPDGGFVAIGAGPSTVMWSPDGLNWLDGDPRQLVSLQVREMAVVGGQVVILGGDDDTPTLWIGDPKIGSWQPLIDLDTSDLEGRLVPGNIGISVGDGTLLVAAATTAEQASDDDEPVEGWPVVIWLVDPADGTATRTVFPVDVPANEIVWPFEWFSGRWHVMIPLEGVEWWTTWDAAWSSADGMSWTEEEFPEGWQTPMLNAPTVGSSGVVTCAAINGDEETAGTWFSPDGVDWRSVGAPFCRGVYSDSLGFISDGEPSFGSDGAPRFYQLSPDGTTLEEWTSPFPFDAVAASGNNIIVNAYVGSEYTAEESAGYKGLWLYHQPGDE